MIKKCVICNKRFEVKSYQVKIGLGKFCSHKCYGISKKGYTPWNKGLKGVVKFSEENKQKMSASLKGKNTWTKGTKQSKEHKQNISNALKEKYIGPKRWTWKTGKVKTTGGYIAIINPNRFKGDKRKYVPEHRFIMENHIGRPLEPFEIVHHINGIVDDNRIENLLMMTKKQHGKLHTSREDKRILWATKIRQLGPLSKKHR